MRLARECAVAVVANGPVEVALATAPTPTAIRASMIRMGAALGAPEGVRRPRSLCWQTGHRFDDDDVTEFFRRLAPHRQGAVTQDSCLDHQGHRPGCLHSRCPGVKAVSENLKTLHSTMVTWAATEPQWLTAQSSSPSPPLMFPALPLGTCTPR